MSVQVSRAKRLGGAHFATRACRDFIWQIALLTLGLVLLSTELRGQDSLPPERGPRWMLGGTLMIPPAGASFSAVGLTAATTRPLRLGTDLAVAIVPRAIASGVFAAAIRANLSVSLPLRPSTLIIPSAGVSLLGAGGTVGFAGTRGYNGTIALVGFGKALEDRTPAIGFRVAYSAHKFGDLVSAPLLHVLEVGVVRRSR